MNGDDDVVVSKKLSMDKDVLQKDINQKSKELANKGKFTAAGQLASNPRPLAKLTRQGGVKLRTDKNASGFYGVTPRRNTGY